jgi:hypothetical protein
MDSNIARLSPEHSYPYFKSGLGGRMPEMSVFQFPPSVRLNEAAMSGVNKVKLLSYVGCAFAVVILVVIAFPA